MKSNFQHLRPKHVKAIAEALAKRRPSVARFVATPQSQDERNAQWYRQCNAFAEALEKNGIMNAVQFQLLTEDTFDRLTTVYVYMSDCGGMYLPNDVVYFETQGEAYDFLRSEVEIYRYDAGCKVTKQNGMYYVRSPYTRLYVERVGLAQQIDILDKNEFDTVDVGLLDRVPLTEATGYEVTRFFLSQEVQEVLSMSL